ncbi:sensor domain-containing diguanylate cyclase [Kistimonas asteriae]|uniref:sensor domain-containing diguanylate cyclase n=1 Tax=Kistimonas asteriae TaxID=517724 RepID=UPI001BAC7A11|nr:diguanylate cyclase [Kistimonas asteriae]
MFKRLALFSMPPVVMTIVLLGSLTLLSFYYEKLLIDSSNDRLKQVADVAAMVFRKEVHHDEGAHAHEEEAATDDAFLDALIAEEDGTASMPAVEEDDAHYQDTVNFDALIDQIATTTGSRITLIDQNGAVLGDSRLDELDLLSVDNHAERPEFVRALDIGLGRHQRYSESQGEDMLYVAVKAYITDHYGITSPYIIRASLPRTMISNQMLQIWMWVSLISFVGIACVIAITIFFNQMMNRQSAREQAGLKAEVKERTRELSLMQQLGSLMSACTTMDSAAKVVHPVAAKLLPGCNAGAISLIKSSRNRLDMLTTWGEEWQGSDRFEPSECWALLKGHAHCSDDDGLEIRCNHSHDGHDVQICIPLVAQGETLGILHLSYPDKEHLEASHAMAESMAEQIGLALANMRLREDLRQQAIRDPMTGLFNRRHMMDFLEQQVYQTENQHKPLSLMMIDLDHFKRFNDTFGHDAGDYVLKQVAIELRQAAGKNDLVCRYGGEEICIICPGRDLDATRELALELVHRIAGQGMQFNGQALGNITLSVGVTTRRDNETSIEKMLKEADDALYEAKDGGRNRAVVNSDNLPPVSNITSIDDVKPSGHDAG